MCGMCQLVEFVNYNNFETLLLFCVELLAARNFLDQFLNDHTVVKFGFTWSYLNMIHAAKNDGLARGGGS